MPATYQRCPHQLQGEHDQRQRQDHVGTSPGNRIIWPQLQDESQANNILLDDLPPNIINVKIFGYLIAFKFLSNWTTKRSIRPKGKKIAFKTDCASLR